MEVESNFREAISALDRLFVNGDYTVGGNGIHRLAAIAEFDSVPKSEVTSYLRSLINQLSSASVRPTNLMIFDEVVLINWHPRGNQVVMTQAQYAGLVIQFAQFIDALPIEHLRIQSNCLDDDPVVVDSYEEVNLFPEFNSKCFGSDKITSIYNISEKYGDDRLWH